MVLSREVLERAVFSVGGQDYRWADVIAAARAWSRWDETAGETRIGLAAVERLSQPIAEAELDEARQAFRYARGLIAAEEMEAWLERWALKATEWTGYLRREIARAQAVGEGGAAPDEADVWAEVVCSGELAVWARDLAARAAATQAGGTEPGQVEPDLARMDEEHASFVERALTPEAAAKALELWSSDWVRLSYIALEFPAAAMASEAALLLREDGLAPPDVAERAGVALQERETFLEDVEPGLSETLLSAPVGELVGPVPVEGGFALLSVTEKIAPTLADPVIQGRLQEEVPRRALEREVRNRVQWHEHL